MFIYILHLEDSMSVHTALPMYATVTKLYPPWIQITWNFSFSIVTYWTEVVIEWSACSLFTQTVEVRSLGESHRFYWLKRTKINIKRPWWPVFLKNVPYWSFPGLDFDGWKRLQDTDGMLCRGNRDCSWIDNSLVCQRMHLEIEPNVIWIFYCGHLACFSSKLGDLRLMLPVKLFIDTGYIACRLGGWVLNCC